MLLALQQWVAAVVRSPVAVAKPFVALALPAAALASLPGVVETSSVVELALFQQVAPVAALLRSSVAALFRSLRV